MAKERKGPSFRDLVDKALTDFQSSQEVIEMHQANYAIMVFNQFNEYQKAGFTVEQAFELVKARGLT